MVPVEPTAAKASAPTKRPTMIVSAIDNREYKLIQGTVLFITVVLVVVNLLVDVVYMIINPRVSYDSKGGN